MYQNINYNNTKFLLINNCLSITNFNLNHNISNKYLNKKINILFVSLIVINYFF